MPSLSPYLAALRDTRATDLATPENSYLPHLKPLLEAALETLSPRVGVLTHPRDRAGAGLADAALVEAGSGDLVAAVEAEAPTTSLAFPPTTAGGEEAWEQARRYSAHLGPTLLTNFVDFVLVEDGREVRRVSLGAWGDLLTGAEVGERTGADLFDLLRDWATRRRAVTKPADLADRLANYARAALSRLEAKEDDGLGSLRRTLKDALGLHFNDRQGEHFFRSTLVQTLFYGLFSAFVLWVREGHAPRDFRWRDAADYLRLPVISAIFEEASKASTLRRLDLRAPIEWAEATLQRVDEEAFFAAFAEEHAIQYFYEPFLEAFDPDLREQLGVWYTPPEVVAYQVRKVHEVLQRDLGVEDGLADEGVVVLDPATGTGSYMLEVARVIHAHLAEIRPATAAARTSQALRTRVFGFEILPAPFVVAHMQAGLLLQHLGAPLAGGERVGIYLTNALTGWNPRDDAKRQLDFAEFEQEREAAQSVKRDARILVMIGNPPYNRFSGVAEDEEADLIAPYKAGLQERWRVRKQLLDDLYIRFFRLAEWRLSENGQRRGVVSFISNSSWLTGLSHPVMREHLLNNFDRVWVDNLQGSALARERSERGASDMSIFSNEYNPRGIRPGVAIATLVDTGVGKADDMAEVHYREFWGSVKAKKAALTEDVEPYHRLTPQERTRWVLAATGEASHYLDWPTVPELFPAMFNGVMTARDGVVTDIEEARLKRRIQDYFDSTISDDELRRRHGDVLTDSYQYDASAVRQTMLARGIDDAAFRTVMYRPFDNRFVYNETRGKLVARSSPEFLPHVFDGNLFLNTTRRQRRTGAWDLLSLTPYLTDLHVHEPDARSFPLFLRVSDMFGEHLEPNVSPDVLRAACALFGVVPASNGPQDDAVLGIADHLFHHAVAVLQSPAYRRDNDGFLRQDWPRVPLPRTREALEASAELGRRVAALLRPDVAVPGVTRGRLAEGLRDLGTPTLADGTPVREGDPLALTVRYTGRGRHEGASGRLWWSPGGYWANVPVEVWNFSIGGYPVLKKWLSYRHRDDLGRPLTLDEVEYVQDLVRRIRALIDLGGDLDENYAAVTTATPEAVQGQEEDPERWTREEASP
ncbi:type ISP restriction/modification enzyme [Deinococcus aestuarii]|uniref:type ISP restriction/modification enzyme n=1 Tax=Deinococcus aestuarii TaxID=2774531 RepID=UPI001C0BE55E|nr:type ISP restriction/modification enzyme [Deinococcus aestuarii]